MVSGHHMNYAKIASAADLWSPRSCDQRQFRQASGHHPYTSDQATCYLCNRPLTDSDFHYRWVISHEETRLDTHIHTAWQAVVMNTAYNFWDASSARSSLSALYTNFQGRFLKLLASRKQCHWHQVSPELRTFCQITALSCFLHLTDDSGKIKVPLSLSASNIHTVSCIIRFPSINLLML